MSDFGRMREYAGEQQAYIEELEAIIDGLPATTKSKFPTRPEGLKDTSLLDPPVAPAPEPAPEPAPTEPAPAA